MKGYYVPPVQRKRCECCINGKAYDRHVNAWVKCKECKGTGFQGAPEDLRPLVYITLIMTIICYGLLVLLIAG